MKIVPINKPGAHCTGNITGYAKVEIDKILGFRPNVADDPDKVKYSWGFTADGVECGIWDYKGSYRGRVYSTYGPDKVFKTLFPPKDGLP
jgi:hypothetical protein